MDLGKETEHNPGWTGEVKSAGTQAPAGDGDSVERQWQTLYAVLLHALADFPEARLAVAQALRDLTSEGEQDAHGSSARSRTL